MKTDLMMFGRTSPFQSVFLLLDTESRGFSDRVPFDWHHQVHRIAQGAFWRDGSREGEGGTRGSGGHVRIRPWIQARRVIREEDSKTSTKTHVRFSIQQWTRNPTQKHKGIFVIFQLRVCLFFLWITLSLCSSSFKCFITFNWNAVYIQTLTSPAGTFLTNTMMPRERQYCTLY